MGTYEWVYKPPNMGCNSNFAARKPDLQLPMNLQPQP